MSPRTSSRPAVAVVIGLAIVCSALVGCSDPDRTGASFCAELAVELPGLTGPIGTDDDIDVLVGRYERLDRITPLAIEDEWNVLTELLKQASDVDVSDPLSRQQLADAAYKAERPARDVARWVESTCGLTMPEVVGIEGPDTTTAVTTVAP